MAKDKSIIEKFTDTVKDIANSASEALKAEEPPKVEANAAYMPFAAQGLVSDPLLIPPIAPQPRHKRTARKVAKTSSASRAKTKRVAPKKARKAAKPSVRGKSKARSATKASAKRMTKGAPKRRSAKRSTQRDRR